jgi:hypothetical protein
MEQFDQLKTVLGLAQDQVVLAFAIIAKPGRITPPLHQLGTGLCPWRPTRRQSLKPGGQLRCISFRLVIAELLNRPCQNVL